MKKVLISFTIILLCIVGSVYYCFFLDGRVFLKNNSKSVINQLSSISIGEEFNLSDACAPSDSVYVVEPYNADFFEQNRHLKVMNKAKRSIEHMTFYEGYCQLIFVKDGKVVSYAEIDRNIADFCDLDSCNTPSTNSKFSVKATLYLDEYKKVHLK